MEEITQYLSYIIIDIPKPQSNMIQKIREKYDPATAMLPVEITIFGSSGTGPIVKNQSINHIITEIEKKIITIKKFKFNFEEIDFFPNTNIFYIKPKQRNYFDYIHNKLSSIDVKYMSSNFPYNPHCTLHTGFGGCLKINDFNIIKKEEIPKDDIYIDNISLIEFNSKPFIFNYIKTWSLK